MNKNSDEQCEFGFFFTRFFSRFQWVSTAVMVIYSIGGKKPSLFAWLSRPKKKLSNLKVGRDGRISKWHVSNFINGIYFDNINKWVLSQHYNFYQTNEKKNRFVACLTMAGHKSVRALCFMSIDEHILWFFRSNR